MPLFAMRPVHARVSCWPVLRAGWDLGAASGERTVLLEKVKRPGGVFWYELEPVRRDDHGTWLHGRPGAAWGAPHGAGRLPVPVVVLLRTGQPWVAWWVGDPQDRRLEIDVCLSPKPTTRGWRYVDLELDPVLHLSDERVEIEDWDEYAASRRAGHMSDDDAEVARATAEELAATLRIRGQEWLTLGWDLLGPPG